MARRTVPRSALVAAPLLACLAGCGGSPPAGLAPSPSPSAPSPPSPAASPAAPSASRPAAAPTRAQLARLRATLVQYRRNEADRIVKIHLRNEGTDQVRVRALRLRWVGLEELAPAPFDTVLAPGDGFDLPVSYGAARCSRDGRPPRAAGQAVVGLGGGEDAAAQQPEQVVTLSGADRLLGKLFTTECASRALAEQVGLSFGAGWRRERAPGAPGGLALHNDVLLERRTAPGPIRVTDLAGNVVLAVAPRQPPGTPARGSGGRALLEVPADTTRATLPIEIRSTGRCDGHALGEVKKPYDVLVHLQVGDAPPQAALVPGDDSTRRELMSFLYAACGVG